MPVTIYHNPKCSKPRQTLALMQEKGVEPEIVEYLQTPPSAAELKEILGMLGLGPRDILRAKEEGIDADLDGDQLIAAIVAHPRALERPIVVTDSRAAVGRPPENVLEII
ncbi:MAG: arsenate reductase (glutaredoxin) [Rhodospirillaceae bacterium]|nr:arsenate reductase (glutaredoxin) [Rhodospirillaceae bacterium]